MSSDNRLFRGCLKVMTVIVFAAMHYAYGFGGTVAVATKGSVSALLFLHYGSLVVTFLFHFVGNMGSLYWNRYWQRQDKRVGLP